jgi:hypothetical protein
VVNSWLIDPLIRDRAQLMVEKKDEAKEEKKEASATPKVEPDDAPVLPDVVEPPK